ncbi:T9SS type A sorting domain-containing protein [candidate division KSB1 bacterium]|nr:T9SS type A sorting domain-containing protein [candidate division KSB1 bacterium]
MFPHDRYKLSHTSRSLHFILFLWLIVIAAPEVTSTPLPAPTLLKPIDGSTTSSRKPPFDWFNVYGASEYDLQIDNQADFSSPVVDVTLTTSDYIPGENLMADTYYWRVRARSDTDSSSWSVPYSFSIYTPEPNLFSPLNGSELYDRTPSFEWNDVTNATGYDFQLSEYSDLSSPIADLTLSISGYNQPTNLAVGTYYWRVRTQINSDLSNWTSIWHFSIVIQAPMLISPFNNTRITNRTPTFDWSNTMGATSYDLQISEQSDFSTLLYDVSTVTSNYALTTELPLGTYYWRVRAWVDADVTVWTAPFSFIVVTIAPTPWFPGNYSTTGDRTPRFDWSAPVGASSYDLEVATDSEFSNVVIYVTTTASEYTPTVDMELGLYYWHVRIHSDTEPYSWSNTYQFTIVAEPQLVSFALNNGARETSVQTVTLDNTVTGTPTQYLASEDVSFTGAVWASYSQAPSFILSADAGVKTVYFKVRNEAGESNVKQDYITYNPPTRVGNGDSETLPQNFTMRCYPNPFYDYAEIVYYLPRPAPAQIGIYDLLGRCMRTLPSVRSVGEHTIVWDGTDESGNRLPAGVYYLFVNHNRKTALRIVKLR